MLANRPDLTLKQLQRTRDLMNAHALDCLVKGYEQLIPTLLLPDPNDRHVLAAAIQASAKIIVTYNLKDFPAKIISQYEIEAQHPDVFISRLIDIAPSVVCSAIRKLRLGLKKPPLDAKAYLSILERQSLTQTVSKLNEFVWLI